MTRFGKLPKGKRLERIIGSENYKNGSFQNLLETPVMVEGSSMQKMLKEFFFSKAEKVPLRKMPIIETNLNSLNNLSSSIIWFGHSSYLIFLDSKSILVDPVFSKNASPVSLFAKAFNGTEFYTPNKIGKIDFLVLTHDHYDHLDYKTILEIHPRVGTIITSLGVGEHLEHWGIEKNKIIETNWGENFCKDGINFYCRPARHFSGRLIKRAQTLWSSFVIEGINTRIYAGGDTGFDEQNFKNIANEFPSIDLAILECGQYNPNWPFIHMAPEETAKAASILNAKKLFPVHWGKFSLSMHPWNEPIKRVVEASKILNLNLLTPKIGEVVDYSKDLVFEEWWN